MIHAYDRHLAGFRSTFFYDGGVTFHNCRGSQRAEHSQTLCVTPSEPGEHRKTNVFKAHVNVGGRNSSTLITFKTKRVLCGYLAAGPLI